MAFRLATAAIEFIGQDQRLTRTLDKVRGRLKSLTATALKFGGVLIGALAARKGIQLAQVQARAEANLIAVLAQTGEAAGFTASQLTKIAAALQDITIFGDEATIEAQALLATFTNIRGEQFLRTLAVGLDRATLKGQKPVAVMEQFGKALNDPIIGLTQLTRVGISFTKQQAAQIKSAVANNNLLEAQNIILKELEARFGGVATAFAKTPAGKLVQLGNVIGDVLEQLGLGFSEAVQRGFGSIQEFAKRVQPIVRGIGIVIGRIISLIITGIESLVRSAGEALGLKDLGITAENVGIIIENVFLKIGRALLVFFETITVIVRTIIAAFQEIAAALDQLPGVDIDASGFDKFLNTMDGFIDDFKKKKGELDKDIATIGAKLLQGVVKDKITELAELLGFKKREKPPISITRPSAAAVKKTIESVGIESPEATFKRLQEFVLRKPEDEGVKAQKEGNKIAGENVDANKAIKDAVDKNREGVTQTLIDLGTRLGGMLGFGAGEQP